MKKTFKDFIAAREQLTNQCANEPHMKISYVSNKYTKIASLDETINIKPKDVIIVEWIFDHTGNVTGISQVCVNDTNININKSISSLKKWLGTNTILTKDNWFV